MTTVASITGKSIREDLQTIMRGLAARHFRKENPLAPETSAWQFAEAHAEQFRAQAVDFLTMVHLEQETAAAARARVN